MDPGLIITLPCRCVRDSFEGLITVNMVEDNFNLVQALSDDVGIDVDAILMIRSILALMFILYD